MCNNCIHKAVCSKFAATGGHVRECEHFKEDRRGRWVPMFNAKSLDNWVECSECQTVGSPSWKCCPVCEAVMGGAEDG